MVDLSVKLGEITLQNPITPASGAFSWEYNDVIDLNRLGGLVAKTICREPRVGNPTPRMAETEAGIIQSIGLPGKGIKYFLDNIVPEYAKFEPPLIVSCSSESSDRHSSSVLVIGVRSSLSSSLSFSVKISSSLASFGRISA